MECRATVISPVERPQPENLFSVDRPVTPEHFVGRKDEVKEILGRLAVPNNRGGSLISGVHGIGKTSLLNYLKSPRALQFWPNLAPDKARFILLPGDVITGFAEKEFWSFVFEDIQIWFEELKSSEEQVPPTCPYLQQQIGKLLASGDYCTPRRIQDFFDRLGQAGLLAVVLLDNLGVLFGRIDPNDPAFFYKLRALLQRPSQYGFTLVAASQQSPDELFRDAKWRGSRFDSGMLHVALSGLSAAEVDRLIDVTTKLLPVEYQFDHDERRFIHAVRERTQGHPGKIQQAAYLLLGKKLGV